MRKAAAVLPSIFIICSISFLLSGCFLKKKESADSLDLVQMASDPLSPEETRGVLREVGSNWVFGQGVGDTAVTVGSVLLFPPYGLFVLANAVADISGYEPVRISDALPEPEREAWTSFYQDVTSGPGRLNAAIAGKEFRTQDSARQRLEERLEKTSQFQRGQARIVEADFNDDVIEGVGDEVGIDDFWAFYD